MFEKCKMLKELSKVVKSRKYDDSTMISKTIRDIKQARHSSVGKSQDFRLPESLPIYFNQKLNMDLVKSTQDFELGRSKLGAS